MYALFHAGFADLIHSAIVTPSASDPSPIEPPYGPTIAGVATLGDDAHRAMPGTLWPCAALIAGNEKSKSQVAMIATAPFEISSSAFVAAVGLSDFVSIHWTASFLPSTPPVLLIWLIRIWNSWPDCRSYGARMPVFAAEIPIRIVPALRPPNAELTVSPTANAPSTTIVPNRA